MAAERDSDSLEIELRSWCYEDARIEKSFSCADICNALGRVRSNAREDCSIEWVRPRRSAKHCVKKSNDPVLVGRGHCRSKDAAVVVVLGSRNLNVGDDIRVATFRVTGVHRSGGIAVGRAVGHCGICIQSASIQ